MSFDPTVTCTGIMGDDVMGWAVEGRGDWT